ncbi:hypothetical protein JCGZ_04958 [Jatropha curcas]|uniref:COBRA C-terminal domain-containing protein n=1 Tax=Jatropha curcas TaxID=180498 RepID=A0A067KRH3_JATCU|nr:hypothetical protein JCGZ_04958 [Jatropha curcas]
MWGAEATEQGNCTRFKGTTLPHCCEKSSVIVNLLPGVSYNMQSQNCCKAGVLTSMKQDPSKYGATFQMNVGRSSPYYSTQSDFEMPENFTLGLPGYTCGAAHEVKPSRYSSDSGRRWTQVLRTWNVTCIYSQFISAATPKCCVSLSAFYNDTIVPCPKCSCRCQEQPGAKCVKYGETPSLLREKQDSNDATPEVVRCTQHMCPIRWNLVVLHPNFKSLYQVFSFNYEPLDQYGNINDTGMFWGIEYYNAMLLQEGDSGNVQTEILLHKDEDFTFREGWALPRRVLFNGDECDATTR